MTGLLHRNSIRLYGRLWHILAAAGCAAFLLPYAAAQPKLESEVKAAFLLNFTRFVDWPAQSFENSSSPLTICIIGDDPFGRVLDQLVEGETSNGRKIEVDRMRRAPAAKSCQVLFVSRSEKNVPALLAGVGTGVLTVSDREKFLNEGGMIALFLEGTHVRFDINLRAATKASLSLNARLLNVARSVQR
jgi:YfiR/HmsC-like